MAVGKEVIISPLAASTELLEGTLARFSAALEGVPASIFRSRIAAKAADIKISCNGICAAVAPANESVAAPIHDAVRVFPFVKAEPIQGLDIEAHDANDSDQVLEVGPAPEAHNADNSDTIYGPAAVEDTADPPKEK